jgi:hypothetical protein
MVSPIRLPSEPEVELPTVPSAEAWRAMTPEARLRFKVEVDAMLKARRLRSLLEELKIEAEETQARAAQATRWAQDALLMMLEVRGISCPDDAREIIERCNEGATLHGWLVRAKTLSTVEEVVAPLPEAEQQPALLDDPWS